MASAGVCKQCVLIAGTDQALRLLMDVLGADVEIFAARSVREALQQLRIGAFDNIVCNVSFDESRMFDFLQARLAMHPAPAPRVVCVKAAAPALSPRTRPAIEAALKALGVHTLIDFPALAAARGEAAAREVLRAAILNPALPCRQTWRRCR